MTFSFSLPKWDMVRRAFWRISDRVDDRFFPVCDLIDPMPTGLAERQAMVERSANDIRVAIAGCRTLAQCYACVDLVRNFQRLHGDSAQVTGWVASLGLELKNKQEEVMGNLTM